MTINLRTLKIAEVRALKIEGLQFVIEDDLVKELHFKAGDQQFKVGIPNNYSNHLCLQVPQKQKVWRATVKDRQAMLPEYTHDFPAEQAGKDWIDNFRANDPDGRFELVLAEVEV